MDFEDRFVLLETKLSYLEDFTARLQSVVLEQEKRMDTLYSENRALKERVAGLQDWADAAPAVRPPHY